MPVSEARLKAQKKYRSTKWKRVPLDIPVLEYEKAKAHIEESGESMNGYIRRLMKEDLEKNG